jgi:hypothetical protein
MSAVAKIRVVSRPDLESLKREVDRRQRPTRSTTIFVIRLRAAPHRDGIRELRALLKVALRRFGLRAISVTEEVVERKGRAA